LRLWPLSRSLFSQSRPFFREPIADRLSIPSYPRSPGSIPEEEQRDSETNTQQRHRTRLRHHVDAKCRNPRLTFRLPCGVIPGNAHLTKRIGRKIPKRESVWIRRLKHQ